MNLHFTKKTFLTALLILSLCADISISAYAGDTTAQNSPSVDNPADQSSAAGASDENSATDETYTDDSSTDGTSENNPSGENSFEDNAGSKDSSDKNNSDKNDSDKGETDKDSSKDDSSADASLTDDAPSENIPANDAADLSENTEEETLTPAAVEGETTFITLSAAGDCTLGVDSRYSRNFNKYYKKKGDSYFFKKVNSIFSQDDITIVNFEGTLTTARKRAKKKFTFKGPKKYASILKNGSIEVVNLANNHSKDYGKTSLLDTQNTMEKNNIGYCRNTTISYQTVNGVKVAFLGFNALEKVTKNQIKAGISQAQSNEAEIIIVSFHWGVERKYYPNKKQKSLGHYAIDCGASLVLGHHPHVLQGIEQYKDRYIVYSLGNFCFGGNSNPKDKDTMIFQQTFSVKDGKLQPDNNAKIIPCSLSSHKKKNDFQPRVLSGKEKKRLIKKMNKLSKKLKISIDSDGNIN